MYKIEHFKIRTKDCSVEFATLEKALKYCEANSYNKDYHIVEYSNGKLVDLYEILIGKTTLVAYSCVERKMYKYLKS